MPGMWRLDLLFASKADVLEADAARAGLALGCRYSTSDEYESEVIRSRREAGIFGPRRQQRQALVAFAIAGVLSALMVLLIEP